MGLLGGLSLGDELVQQDSSIDLVVLADGSGGTHAGLVAALGDHERVLGVDVGARTGLEDAIRHHASETSAFADLLPPVGVPQVDHEQVGGGYGVPTDACRDAIELAARTEGLLLDPIYTGKALAGLVEARRTGKIGATARVVFLHTGGLPAMFVPEYSTWLVSRRPPEAREQSPR